MTLPKKDDKGYLKVQRSDGQPSIAGRSEHIAELAALFEQRGIPCRREPSAQAGEEALLFELETDVAAVKAILEAYKSAKGS